MFGASLQTVPPGVDGHQALKAVQKRVWGSDGPAASSAEASVTYLRSEHMLVRFLVARQWDVEKTVAMLQNHYTWLGEINMEALLNDPFPEEQHIKLFYPQIYHGTDKLGRPVYIERPGLIDMPRLLQVVAPERLLQYMYAGAEQTIRRRLPACSLARGEVVDKTLNIMDLSGLNFRVVTHTTARRVLREFIVALQNHYPETTGRMIIINAPKVFSIAWSFVKPMLDEKTVNKISIFGCDPATYTEVLLDLIDADQLPKLFGGRCLCDGHDMASCMRTSKGPWNDAEVKSVLDARDLEYIMTPEGSQLLQQSRAYFQQLAEQSDPTAQPTEEASSSAPVLPSQSCTDPQHVGTQPELAASSDTAADEPQPKESSETTPAASDLPVTFESFCEVEQGPETPATAEVPAPALKAAMELSNAELEVALLREECHHHEEMHIKALHDWVHESNALVEKIGRPVIDRAQGYYDSLSLHQQARAGHAKQQEEADHIECELEKATVNLEMAEAAFQSCLAGNEDALSDAQWDRLAPLPEDVSAAVTVDAHLRRSFRVSALTDRVASLHSRHATALTELAAAIQEVEKAEQRFTEIDLTHSRCGRNCSVRRAAPFFEKRQAHEDLVEAQLTMLQAVERRLHQAHLDLKAQQEAQLRAAQVETSPAATFQAATFRTVSGDEMSLKCFELSGAEPKEDEYLSCDSDISDEEG
mmetsp:Transcript_13771/g.26243  ORF Transcript_13771/g.26243 Transcript_13771/m.26243 type:complete len:702 (-) Transcript_13771:106-2211(-)